MDTLDGAVDGEAPRSRTVRARDRVLAWGLFAGFGGMILLTQELAVDASYFLVQRDLLRLTIYVAAAAAAWLLVDRIAFVTRPRRRWQWVALAVGFGLLAFELLHIQRTQEDSSEAFHCVEFLVLVLLAGQAWSLDQPGLERYALAAITVAAFGLLDEGIQSLHVLRNFDWSDVMLDARVSIYGVLTMPALVTVAPPAPQNAIHAAKQPA